MKEVVIDKRTKEDVIAQIKELSKSYTPEWRYDEENGDMGTALANVYAEMFYRTLQLFNGLIDKNKISFFNQLEAKMLPAKASSGYVTFHLVDAEVQGVEVDSGTFVLADLPDAQNPKGSFETIEDLDVTPAKSSHMIEVSGHDD